MTKTDKTVEAVDLRDRLRGKYAKGPRLANGEPEFGYAVFEGMPDGKDFPAIHGEAADMIDALLSELSRLQEEVKGLRWVVDLYDGEPTGQAIGNELADYAMILDNVGKVYDHVTGGRISKANTAASAVIAVSDDHVTSLVEEEVAERLAAAREDRPPQEGAEPVAWVDPDDLASLWNYTFAEIAAVIRKQPDDVATVALYTTPPDTQDRIEALEGVCKAVVAAADDPGKSDGVNTIRLLTELRDIAIRARAALHPKEGGGHGG